MDIYCPKCGEPYDHDELHDVEEMSYSEASREFRQIGCEVFDTPHGEISIDRANLARAMYDVLGDDLDGAAAMFDDVGL